MLVDGIPELMDLCEHGKKPLQTMLQEVLNDTEIEQVMKFLHFVSEESLSFSSSSLTKSVSLSMFY